MPSLHEIELRQDSYRRSEIWGASLRKLKRHKEADFEAMDWDDEPRAWEQILSGGFVVLVGPYGTGKTQLAVKIAYRACFETRIPMRAEYTTAHDLFESMRREFDDGGQGTHAGRMALAPLLIVDELGAMTEFETKEFRRIVDRRYAAMKPSVYISNRSSAEFMRDVGPAVVDRMRETGLVLVLDGTSKRASR